MRHRIARSAGAATLTALLAVTAVACGTDDGAETSTQVSTTEHNDADVAFASDMLQHHAQALSMVDLTRDRPLDSKVQQLTEQIRDAQAPEIELFSDWLTEWGEEIPPTVRDHVNAGHGSDDSSDPTADLDHGDMPGMMTAEEMDELESASDSEFQTLWLEMMIEHHAGAVAMAEGHQEDGRYAPAVDLAGDIVESQSAEIEAMRGLLDS